MKTEAPTTSSKATCPERQGEGAKLVSLLALAAGAAAIPQSAEADIFYTNVTGIAPTVGFGPGDASSYLITLPGIARLGFQRVATTSSGAPINVVLGGQAGGYVRIRTSNFLAVHVGAGRQWSTMPGTGSANGTIGIASSFRYTPGSYSGEYLAFAFKDSTQGNALRFGWVQVNLENNELLLGDGPEVTVLGYAYDDTGAPIHMGVTAVPEPSSTALMALGALALGARGVRAWRKQSK